MTYNSVADSLPLRPIEWDRLADPALLNEWPPYPTRARIDRLNLYYALYHGVLDRVVDYAVPVGVNVFQAAPMAIADLLTANPPSVSDTETETQVRSVAYRGVVDMYRYGGALVFTDPDGDIQLLDPRYWVPTPTGWMYAEPRYSLRDGTFDSVHFMWQDGDLLTVEERVASYSSVGPRIDASPSVTVQHPPDALQEVYRQPDQDRWGTSLFEVLVAPVAEIYRRMSADSAALDSLSDPMFVWEVAQGDYPMVAPAVSPTEPVASTPAGVSNQIAKISEAGDPNNRVVPRAVQSGTVLSWDPKLGDSMSVTMQLIELCEGLTHTPGLLRGVFTSNTSGRMLKLMHLPFYSTSSSTQAYLLGGMNESLAAAGSNVSVEWQHVFDFIDESFEGRSEPEEAADADAPVL